MKRRKNKKKGDEGRKTKRKEIVECPAGYAEPWT
jgi:hypothetical protein